MKSQPAPAYLVRAVVQLFTSRAELLDKGETTDQHKTHQLEEAGRIEADKNNLDPKQGGLFRGTFNKARPLPAGPIIDLEDGVVRCPQCSWELDEEGCVNCGYRPDDDSMSGTDWRSDSDNSEMTDDPYEEVDDEVEDGFGEPPGFDWTEWYDGMPLGTLPAEFRYVAPRDRNGFGVMPGIIPGAFPPEYPYGHSGFDSHDSHDSVHDEDDEEEDEDEDEDMDSFIDDDEPSMNYASDSDRSTVVGHPEYSRAELNAIFNDSPGSGYSTVHPSTYHLNRAPDSEDDEDDDEDEDSDTADGSEADDDENEDGDDEDDDDEPIRPAAAGNRRRVPTYQILSSSPPARANGASATNNANLNSRPRAQPPVGSSANRAISLGDDDDSEDEGPVAATRRARSRGNFRPSAF